LERVAPITWADFTEALLTEGLGGAVATLPGATGVGVQSYDEDDRGGAYLERIQPLASEFVKFKKQLPEIRRLKDEGEEEFGQRVKVFGEGLEHFGMQLVNSPEYRQAPEQVKQRALELLPRRISSGLMKQGQSWRLAPSVLILDASKDALQQQQRGPRPLYNAQGERLR
jgi:hypothetical protein